MRIEVSTQAEFDEALSNGHVAVCVSGSFRLTTTDNDKPSIVVCASVALWLEAWESSQPHVVAWGSSQPHVEARGSSQPHVVAWGSSQPHVEARESSQPHVEARESSQPHVEAWAYVQAVFRGRVIAGLSGFVSAVIFGKSAKVEGGRQVYVDLSTPKAWCDYYGIEVSSDGVTVLYKALNDDFTSPYGFPYIPGTTPEAPDWDGGARECGGGLHFSPTPQMARVFHEDAKRYCACPVNLTDIAVHPDGDYPEKVKARCCCAPVWEVDLYGRSIGVDKPKKKARTKRRDR